MKPMFQQASKCLVPVLLLLGSACVAEPLDTTDPTQETEEAVTTCVTIQRGTGGATDDVTDALLADITERKAYGASESLTAGLVGTGARFALLRFGLTAIPANATIVSATATLHLLLGTPDGVAVRAHQSTASWVESWVTCTTYQYAYLAAVVATFPSATTTTADLTSLVQGWVSGAIPNDGIFLERPFTGSTVFASSEIPTQALRPSLQVCYQ